jgi:hypothetical protein
MSIRVFSFCALALLGACSHHSEFYLWDAGYTIGRRAEGYAFEVHRNQMKHLGGDIDSVRFRQFVFDRLTWHQGCEGGWEYHPCVADRSCVVETKRSITVLARCTKA